MKSRNRILEALLVTGLLVAAAAPADAQTRPASAKPAARSSTTFSASARQPDEPAALLAAIEELKKLVADQGRQIEAQQAVLREQRKKMEELERRLEQPATAQAAPPAAQAPRAEDVNLLGRQIQAVADNQKELSEHVAKVQTALADTKRNAEGRFRQIGNFRFSGDLRLRYEPFFQDGALTRQRNRLRARFNLMGNITDELYGGISVASGSLDDPISTNQTLTGFFNRKSIGFDKMFIQYTPKLFANHLTVGGGKFAYPWVRTPLTFDTDLNPEGFFQQVKFDFKNDIFKNLTLVGFQLPFFETTGTISTSGATAGQVTSPGHDSAVFGGQIQTRWRLGDRANLGLHVAVVNFINSDRIAQAFGGELRPSLPNSNTLRTNASGVTVGYASRFLYLDTIAQLDVRTKWPTFPINVLFNFTNNLRATQIIQNGTNTPTGQADNPERSAYWAEIQFGRQQEQKDIQFGYTLIRIEKDAVIGAFNESDLRSSTNVRNHRLSFSYQARRNVQINYTLWLGRLGDARENTELVPPRRRLPGSACATSPFTGCKDTWLKRMQLDLVYKF